MHGNSRYKILYSLVLMVLMVLTAMISGLLPAVAEAANPALRLTRALSAASVNAGDTVTVTVTFRAPDNVFNSIGLTENIPTNWTATLDETSVTPAPMTTSVANNTVNVIFDGPYASGTQFSVTYRLRSPASTVSGTYTISGALEYYVVSTNYVETLSLIHISEPTRPY